MAEGQWGLFSPLVIGIGLLATWRHNVLVFATAVKLVAGLRRRRSGTFACPAPTGPAAPLAFVAAVAASRSAA